MINFHKNQTIVVLVCCVLPIVHSQIFSGLRNTTEIIKGKNVRKANTSVLSLDNSQLKSQTKNEKTIHKSFVNNWFTQKVPKEREQFSDEEPVRMTKRFVKQRSNIEFVPIMPIANNQNDFQ